MVADGNPLVQSCHVACCALGEIRLGEGLHGGRMLRAFCVVLIAWLVSGVVKDSAFSNMTTRLASCLVTVNGEMHDLGHHDVRRDRVWLPRVAFAAVGPDRARGYLELPWDLKEAGGIHSRWSGAQLGPE